MLNQLRKFRNLAHYANASPHSWTAAQSLMSSILGFRDDFDHRASLWSNHPTPAAGPKFIEGNL